MTETATPPESYGHTSICADVTTNRNEYKALEITLLIEHDLIIELEEGRIHNASKKYREFTKIVAILFHGHHSPDEIRTALILAEDHLTVILEDGDIECAISFKYAEKALNFIRRFLNYHGKAAENTVTDSVDVAKTTDKAPVQEFTWKMAFTDLVEMLDALIEMNAVEIPERCRKDFITAVFRLFGVKKSVADFNKARHKLAEKMLEEPETTNKKNPKLKRGTFLPLLHENLEKAWEKRYMDNNPRRRA